MELNLVRIGVLTVLLSTLMISCASVDKSNINFLYENYTEEEVVLPKDSIFNLEDSFYTDDILIKKESFLNENNHRIVGELYDYLYNLDVINQWKGLKDLGLEPFSSYTREEIVSKMKETTRIAFLGKLNLSKNYNSYLIVVSTGKTDAFAHREAFLINVADSKVSSITSISVYSNGDDSAVYYYTMKSKNGFFIQTDKELKPGRKIRGIEFSFDDKGYLVKQ